MKKIIFILLLLYYSCTSEKVETEEVSKSDKLFKVIKDVAKDKLGKSKVDCHQRCENSLDLIGWNRESKGEEFDTLFNECVEGCIKNSEDSPEPK